MKSDLSVDCFGMMCPMPIIKTAQAVNGAAPGQVVEIIASDEGIVKDMPAWCEKTGNEFISCTEQDGEYRVYVKKKGNDG